MRFDDVPLGIVILLFGITIILLSADFEPLRHISYGPGFFPTLIGVGFLGCGAALIGRRVVGHLGRGPWITLGDWSRSSRHIVNFLLIPISVVLYILFSDAVGFLLTMFALLALQLAWFTRHIGRSVVIAIIVTLLLQGFFQGFMSVPLPWGILERYSGAFTWL